MTSRRISFAVIALVAAAASSTTGAQTRRPVSDPDLARPLAAAPSNGTATNLTGSWVYRSYHNKADVLVGDDPGSAARALDLLFGEGIMVLNVGTDNRVSGSFDMGAGFVLDLTGVTSGNPPDRISLVGIGRANTPTDGWEYDYNGQLGYVWPTSIDQVPTVVGTVLRAKPHGKAKAGYVASFIAVKRP